MFPLPTAAEPLLDSFCVAFSRRVFQRAVTLLVGAVLTMGRRTVTSALWTVRSIADGHFSSYHRVLSRASWSLWPLGKALATAVVARVPQARPVGVAMDDTVTQHRGPKVYGKGKHRDAVRSTHSHTVWMFGHKWVVLAIIVAFPFTSRRWALPVLCALYRSKELNKSQGRRHKTPAQLARQLMAVLIHWFPGRKFVFLGDGGYASHELAVFCHRHRTHATLISRAHPDANLYAPPPKRGNKTGRPRIKGRKLLSPRQSVAKRRRGHRATVHWYGGSDRRVELTSDTGHWYKAGDGLVPLRWVHVHDIQGTHRDDWVYSTDPSLSPGQIVGFFTGRWPIETTFQEVRFHLGFHTPRQRTERSVLRTAPCLLGLYSAVCLIFAEQVKGKDTPVRQTPWYTKTEPTFADAIATVRRLFWAETVLKGSPQHRGFQKLPPALRRTLLDHLSQAA
jgi:hypothetical protein